MFRFMYVYKTLWFIQIYRIIQISLTEEQILFELCVRHFIMEVYMS